MPVEGKICVGRWWEDVFGDGVVNWGLEWSCLMVLFSPWREKVTHNPKPARCAGGSALINNSIFFAFSVYIFSILWYNKCAEQLNSRRELAYIFILGKNVCSVFVRFLRWLKTIVPQNKESCIFRCVALPRTFLYPKTCMAPLAATPSHRLVRWDPLCKTVRFLPTMREGFLFSSIFSSLCTIFLKIFKKPFTKSR